MGEAFILLSLSTAPEQCQTVTHCTPYHSPAEGSTEGRCSERKHTVKAEAVTGLRPAGNETRAEAHTANQNQRHACDGTREPGSAADVNHGKGRTELCTLMACHVDAIPPLKAPPHCHATPQ